MAMETVDANRVDIATNIVYNAFKAKHGYGRLRLCAPTADRYYLPKMMMPRLYPITTGVYDA